MKQPFKTPGPGQYNPKDAYRSASFTMRSRPKIRVDKETPGPGQYTDKKVFPNTPRATIGKADNTWLSIDKNPGPGSYENFKNFRLKTSP